MENPVIVSVLLKDGVDQNTFVSSFDSVSEVELHDLVESLVSLVVFKVERSYLPTLRSNSSVKEVEDPDMVIEPQAYPSEPSELVITGKTVGWPALNTSSRGDSNLSLQHYYDNDSLIRTTSDAQYIGNEFGTTSFNDSAYRDSDSHTFRNKYNGEHVDIVIVEAATDPNASENHGETHPEFRKHDDSSVYRWNKIDWGLTSNNQVSGDPLFSAHGLKALGVAIGLNSGYGKKSNGYLIYNSPGNSTVSILNAVKTWHENKAVNSSTGLKNPTICVYEFQYPTTFFNFAIKIDDIVSITGPSGTTNRPDGGWGTDFTPFINLHMIPRKLLDPIDSNWYWVMTFPRQSDHRSSSLKTATEQLWDAGVTVIDSGGNYTHTYANEDDEDDYYCTISGTTTLYQITGYDPITMIRSMTTTANWYPHYHYSVAGINKCISTCAGQNSEHNPILDYYTSRGPGVDLIGRGSSTWCVGNSSDNTYADGVKWGTFGGNSCSIPTIAGKLACIAEKFYIKNNAWPTPDQLKNAAISESRPSMVFQETADWSNVPSASDTDISGSRSSTTNNLEIVTGRQLGNSYIYDQAGTPNRQTFINAKGYNREQTYKKRPTSGVLFPRPSKFKISRPQDPYA